MPVTRTYLLIYNYTNCGHMAPALLQHGWTKLKFVGRSSLFSLKLKKKTKQTKKPQTKNPQELLLKSHMLNKGNTKNASRQITAAVLFQSYVLKRHTLKIYNNHGFLI